jgi:hypothetical protein
MFFEKMAENKAERSEKQVSVPLNRHGSVFLLFTGASAAIKRFDKPGKCVENQKRLRQKQHRKKPPKKNLYRGQSEDEGLR